MQRMAWGLPAVPDGLVPRPRTSDSLSATSPGAGSRRSGVRVTFIVEDNLHAHPFNWTAQSFAKVLAKVEAALAV